MNNFTNEVETVLFSKTPGLCGGRWVVQGTRIEPRYVKRAGKAKASAYYPHLSESQIESCLNFRTARLKL